jgi:AraC family transcriptional regulator of adaptative response/methylated-DNA-[protein]-cysteine methyltransferase
MSTLPKSRSRDGYASDEARWQAVVERDAGADGRFFYSVKTTGVYCRPSCSSRLPLRRNVEFYASATEAEAAGFRPCKRCSPAGASRAEEHAAAIAKACRLIEGSVAIPKLDELAWAVGLSTFHFHRLFKGITGVTPKDYAKAHRTRRVRQSLNERHSVTEAIYEAGFGSSSRFYENSAQTLGMTPTSYRKGGEGTRIRFAVGECSLGSVLVAATETGVCAITLGDEPEVLLRDLQDRFPKAVLIGGDAEFELTVAQVIGFIEAPKTAFALPLDIRGTAFQQKVWKALREIPVGTTLSYSEIAERIGAPKSVRAVASACAANHIAVAIPCHRVVRNDGNLSGYRWGVERKRSLLARESAWHELH